MADTLPAVVTSGPPLIPRVIPADSDIAHASVLLKAQGRCRQTGHPENGQVPFRVEYHHGRREGPAPVVVDGRGAFHARQDMRGRQDVFRGVHEPAPGEAPAARRRGPHHLHDARAGGADRR
ncbi:hypothetical protein Airi01_096210 [Actinoallomurus iriomotensis]|uniref:Uncharacterized protein n=1 Tax=Actinoallomurus iriomotensis TaxID=478107 RepID=A0A9W6VVM6_9ACTN|nr:hypothetical protein Airi01_096210 [Actinoallomurus iriomotensis]